VLWIAMQVTMVVVALAALSYELLRYAHIIGHRTSVTVVKKTVNVVTRPIAHDATKGRVAHDSRVPALEREIESLRARVGEMDAAIAKVQAVAIPVPLPLPRPRAAPVPVPVPIPVPQTIPKVGDIQKGIDWVKRQGEPTRQARHDRRPDRPGRRVARKARYQLGQVLAR
jgi:hypothetical protein